ncbi:hypothetical protein Hanom_Chr15g01385691 [Helianthus anomalus]
MQFLCNLHCSLVFLLNSLHFFLLLLSFKPRVRISPDCNSRSIDGVSYILTTHIKVQRFKQGLVFKLSEYTVKSD